MSDRYIADRFLPDKAIDLVDEVSCCLTVACLQMNPASGMQLAASNLHPASSQSP